MEVTGQTVVTTDLTFTADPISCVTNVTHTHEAAWGVCASCIVITVVGTFTTFINI